MERMIKDDHDTEQENFTEIIPNITWMTGLVNNSPCEYFRLADCAACLHAAAAVGRVLKGTWDMTKPGGSSYLALAEASVIQ